MKVAAAAAAAEAAEAEETDRVVTTTSLKLKKAADGCAVVCASID